MCSCINDEGTRQQDFSAGANEGETQEYPYDGTPKSIRGRIIAATWDVQESVMQTADAIEKRHGNVSFNSLGFLAQSARPNMLKMTPHDKTEPDSFAVSDEVSRANIAILSVLLSELLQHYNDQSKELSEFMNGPLKPIVSDWHNTLPAMKSFVRGSQMDLTQKGTLNEPPGTDLAYPLSCFACIHRPAILAFSQNISNDSLEAGWSLTSTKFRQGCKAATHLFWGMFVRRPNWPNGMAACQKTCGA